MIFGRSVRKSGKEFIDLEKAGVRLTIDFSGNEKDIENKFLRDLLSGSRFGITLKGSDLHNSGFLFGKAVRSLNRKRKGKRSAEALHSERDSVVSFSVNMDSRNPLEFQVLGPLENVKDLDLFLSGFCEGMEGEVSLFAKGDDLNTAIISVPFCRNVEYLLQ